MLYYSVAVTYTRCLSEAVSFFAITMRQHFSFDASYFRISIGPDLHPYNMSAKFEKRSVKYTTYRIIRQVCILLYLLF